MTKKLFVFAALILLGMPCLGSTQAKIKALEEKMKNLEKKIEILSERSSLLVDKNIGTYQDRSYFRTGLNLIFPRGSTFSYSTDTGIGVYAGFGHYLKENHIVEAGLDWDLYPALNLRYRWEWQNKSNTLHLGPVVGVKFRLAHQKPLDNYLDSREDLQGAYGIFGFSAGHPLGFSMVQTEVLAFFNRQFFVVASFGLHFFI